MASLCYMKDFEFKMELRHLRIVTLAPSSTVPLPLAFLPCPGVESGGGGGQLQSGCGVVDCGIYSAAARAAQSVRPSVRPSVRQIPISISGHCPLLPPQSHRSLAHSLTHLQFPSPPVPSFLQFRSIALSFLPSVPPCPFR